LERDLRAFGPKFGPFWNVRMSQGLERSALATSPRDKTQEFRHQSWDPRSRKNSAGSLKLSPKVGQVGRVGSIGKVEVRMPRSYVFQVAA
jgi:hypothetical protein